MKALLDDLRALEYMLDNSLIAPDVQRVGAEQEMFLVDSNMRPAPVAMEILAHAQDPRLTTEIAIFNLEANLTPVELNGRCFSQMEAELRDVIESAKKSAKKFQSEVLLTGILPTLQKGDLTLDNMTPNPRYPAHARQHHDGIVHGELSGPPAGESCRLRGNLQHGPGRRRSRSCGCRKLAHAARASSLAGDTTCSISAFGGCPFTSSTGA
jgi:hypothetical protein